MRLIVKGLSAATVLFVFFFSFSAFAFTRGFEALVFRPVTDGGPYIGIWGSKNQGPHTLDLGTLAAYSHHPLQLTTSGNRSRGILDHTLVQHLYAQFGLMERWLSVGFDLPVGWWVNFIDPAASSTADSAKLVIGDVYINFKSEVFQSPKFGLAIRPFVSIPTGYANEFFGNGNITGGGTAIAEVRPLEKWSLALNVGVQGRETFTFRTTTKDTQMTLGIGTVVQVSKSVSVVGEIASMTRLKRPFRTKGASPVEGRGAIKWQIGKTGLTANVGGIGGIVRGSGSPDYGVFAGLTFRRRLTETSASPTASSSTVKLSMVGLNVVGLR